MADYDIGLQVASDACSAIDSDSESESAGRRSSTGSSTDSDQSWLDGLGTEDSELVPLVVGSKHKKRRLQSESEPQSESSQCRKLDPESMIDRDTVTLIITYSVIVNE